MLKRTPEIEIPDGLKERANRTARFAGDRANQGIHVGLLVRHDDPQKLRDAVREYMASVFSMRVSTTGIFDKRSIGRGESSAFVDDVDYVQDSRIAEVARRKVYITRTIGNILNDQHVFQIFVRLANEEKAGRQLVLRNTDGNLKTVNGEGNEVLLQDFFSGIFGKPVTLGFHPSEKIQG